MLPLLVVLILLFVVLTPLRLPLLDALLVLVEEFLLGLLPLEALVVDRTVQPMLNLNLFLRSADSQDAEEDQIEPVERVQELQEAGTDRRLLICGREWVPRIIR